MKHLRITALAIIAVVLPMVTFAQKNVQKAFEKFVSNTRSNGIYNYTEDKESNDAADYYYSWSFRLSKTDSERIKKIEALKNAFYQDASSAYSLDSKEAGTKGTTWNIGYGSRLQNNLPFGTLKDHNYIIMNVRDRRNSLRRDVYAMEWWKDGGKIEGKLHHISSFDPQRATWDGTKIVERRKSNSATVVSPTTVKTVRSISTTNNPDGSTIVRLGNGETYEIAANGTIERKSADGKKQTLVVRNTGISSLIPEKISSSDDVITTFGNLRSAYIKAVKDKSDESVMTAIAQYVYRLFKEHSGKLSKDERQLCIMGIRDMKFSLADQNNTSYTRGLFNLSLQILDK